MKLKSNTRKKKFIFKGKHLILGVVTIIVLLLPFLLSNLQKIKFKSKPRADFEAQAEPLIEYFDGQQCDNEGQYQVQCKGPPETCNSGGGFVGKVINCRKNSTGELRWVFYTECVGKEEYLRGEKYNCSRENFAPISNNNPPEQKDETVDQNKTDLTTNNDIKNPDVYISDAPINSYCLNTYLEYTCRNSTDVNGNQCKWATYNKESGEAVTECMTNDFYNQINLPAFTPTPLLNQPCNYYSSKDYCLNRLDTSGNQDPYPKVNCIWTGGDNDIGFYCEDPKEQNTPQDDNMWNFFLKLFAPR